MSKGSIHRALVVVLIVIGFVLVWVRMASAQQQPLYTKEQIEQIKKQNEKAANMNVLIEQANAAMTAKNWQGAVGPMQQLIAIDPANWSLYSVLGDAQLNLGQYDQAAIPMRGPAMPAPSVLSHTSPQQQSNFVKHS
jgi:tetratricopeptide (TPR) repeat protein